MAKQRRRQGYKIRKVANRNLIERFLIVCEGEKTEPQYFINFRIPVKVVDIHGLGANTTQIVDRAIELREEDGDYDQVWCVFDRDSFPPKRFNEAIAKAKISNVSTAYSNEAFELWYLLHFNYYDAAIARRDYPNMLTNLLGRQYRKNDPSIYDDLLPLQQSAIRNARRLLTQYDPHFPERDNPCTTVYKLVEKLISARD